MVDLVRPLKIEDSVEGSQDNFGPTETDPTEDYLTSKGIAIEDDSTIVDKDASGNMQFTDTNTGVKTLDQLAVINETEHAGLNTLTHNISEDSYIEYVRTSNLISDIIYWTDSGKTTKIREENYTRSGNLISSFTIKQYDETGSLLDTETHTLTRSSNLVTNETVVIT